MPREAIAAFITNLQGTQPNKRDEQAPVRAVA
jgi:hypothetical protein